MANKKLNPIELEKIRQGLTPRSEAPELYVPEAISTSAIRKQELLKLAQSGADKPNSNPINVYERKLRLSLYSYILTSSECYDPDFTNMLKTLRPDWFVDTTSSKKKRELLELARSGSIKPRLNSKAELERKMARSLSYYVCKVSGSYDPEFDIQIREIRPDWFVNTANLKKDELLKIAMRGDQRPSTGSKDKEIEKLGTALINYTKTKSEAFDPGFSEKIRTLRPDWFVNTANLKKDELLQMAARGDNKPSSLSKDSEIKKLWRAFGKYTRPNSLLFDYEFTEKIRTLRPDWLSPRTACA